MLTMHPSPVHGGAGEGVQSRTWRSPEVGVHPPLSLPDQVSLEPSLSEGRCKGPEACGRSVCPKKRDGGAGWQSFWTLHKPLPLGGVMCAGLCSHTRYGGHRWESRSPAQQGKG